MKEKIISIVKTGAILLAIGFICTLILTVCNYVTKDRILMLSAKSEQDAMIKTLPEAKSFVKINYTEGGIVTAVYQGKDDAKTVIGHCVKVEPIGYGGAISMIVGIGTDGVVKGVDIVSMSETPGLGAKADNDAFTDTYIGKKSNVKIKKSGVPGDDEVAAISGATITSKAVTEGVNAAISAAQNLK